MKRSIVGVFVVFVLIAAACGGRDDPPQTAGNDPVAPNPSTDETTVDTSVDPCEGIELEATEIGVTAEKITVVAMADNDSPLAPGLFKGAWDGAEAWARNVNDNGGLACRDVEVVLHDSKLNPTETTNGFLKACQEALALVGTTVLFSSNTEDLNTCADKDGNAIGVPDLAYITTETTHQCSANSFHMSRPAAACPYTSGPREFTVNAAPVAKVLELTEIEEQNGAFIVPADLPSTVAASVPQIRGHEELGIDYGIKALTSGSATQAEVGEILPDVRQQGTNFIYNGSNDQAMIKLRKEAEAQGIDTSAITWMCSLSCYTPDFISQGGADVEDTWLWMLFLPFSETDANEELATFMSAVDADFPPAWAAGAWADGVLLEKVIDEIVTESGPNGITRQALLDKLRATTDFDVNGWWGDTDFTTTNTTSPCYVLLKVEGGEYVRKWPEAAGEIECSTENVFPITADPSELSN